MPGYKGQDIKLLAMIPFLSEFFTKQTPDTIRKSFRGSKSKKKICQKQ